jgi:hypothetical protein
MPDLGLTLVEVLELVPPGMRRAKVWSWASATIDSSFDLRLREIVRLRSANLHGCRL